ncbi:VP5 [Gokushovirus WZ-2015a]|nr:VP5 [Gokushovirus WZ-2015a]
MRFPLYSMHDVHTGFLAPSPADNDAVAMRNFRHAMLNKDSLLYTHPADYRLYCLGEYDSLTGEISGETPRLICTGLDLRDKE